VEELSLYTVNSTQYSTCNKLEHFKTCNELTITRKTLPMSHLRRCTWSSVALFSHVWDIRLLLLRVGAFPLLTEYHDRPTWLAYHVHHTTASYELTAYGSGVRTKQARCCLVSSPSGLLTNDMRNRCDCVINEWLISSGDAMPGRTRSNDHTNRLPPCLSPLQAQFVLDNFLMPFLFYALRRRLGA